MLAKKRIGLLFVMVALALPQGEARDKDYDARKHLVKAAKHRAKYNWEKMFKEARKSSRLMPTLAESYFYMGLYYYQKGQTPAAQVEFTRAIERSWNSAEPHIYLGNLAFDAGDLDRAIDEWNVGLKLDPDNPEGLANLAAGLYMSGEKLKARQHLKRALVGDPRYHNADFLRDKKRGPAWSEERVQAIEPVLRQVQPPADFLGLNKPKK